MRCVALLMLLFVFLCLWSYWLKDVVVCSESEQFLIFVK